MVPTTKHRQPPQRLFPQFIVLPENRSARNAVRRLAALLTRESSPKRRIPPLFLHGPTGTGKTALTTALMEHVAQGEFTRTAQAIPAIDLGRMLIQPPNGEDVIHDFRDIDLLVLEDVQQLLPQAANAVAALMDRQTILGRCIVGTGTSGPGELRHLSPRLTNRFAGGLVVGFQPLGQSARRKLAQHWCRERNVRVQEDVLDWLAEKPTPGARPILGEILRLEQLTKVFPQPLTLAIVQEQLAQSIQSIDSELDRITDRVAEHFGVSVRTLKGKARHHNLMWARQVAIYLARELTGFSLMELGHYFGKRDHTTILHSCRKVENATANDSATANELRELRATLE